MKIAVPTTDDRGLAATVAEHFGRSAFYTIVDTDTEEILTESNRGHHFGGAGLPAQTVADAGVDVVLCTGLGRRAVALFSGLDVEVFMGAQGTVQDALNAYKEGRLQPATEAGACPGREHEGERRC